nr:ribonuclease S-7-like [Gleditsia microphylla]
MVSMINSLKLKPFLLLLLVLLLACALCSCESETYQARPRPRSRPKPGYDHMVLALRWPNGFCNEPHITCRPSPPEQQYFTLHGLWPVKYGPDPSECEADAVKDEILVELKDDLLKYWPRLSSAKNFEYSKHLWRMQWFEHGSCSSNTFSPKQYFELGIALGKDYGEKILKYLKDEGIKPDGRTEYNTASIVKAIKKGTGKVGKISCTKDKSGKLQLSEVLLCFHVDAKTQKNCILGSPSCNENFIFASERPLHTSFLGLVSSAMEVEEATGI